MTSSLVARETSEKITTMKVSQVNRDALGAIAATLGGVSLDDALGDVLFIYESMKAVERLSPQQVSDWQAEAHEWAETDTEVTG